MSSPAISPHGPAVPRFPFVQALAWLTLFWMILPITLGQSAPQRGPISVGRVSWWPGEGSAADVVGPNSGTLLNGVGFDTGANGSAFTFDGVDDYVEAPALGLPTGNSDRNSTSCGPSTAANWKNGPVTPNWPPASRVLSWRTVCRALRPKPST